MSTFNITKNTTLIACSIIFILSFLIYSHTTAAYNLGYADSDELTLAGHFLGIPHHPGYPLFTWLLHIFTSLPIPGTLANKAHLFSAFLQSLTLALILPLFNKLNSKHSIHPFLLIPIILATGLTNQYWFFSSVTEVFPLNHLISIIFLIIFCSAYTGHSILIRRMCFVIFGLGLSHHPTFRIFSLPLLLLIWQQKSHPLQLITNILLTVGSFLISYLLLFPLVNSNSPISWPFQPSFSGIWEAFNYTIYTDYGSAVQTYTQEINLTHSLKSLATYLQFIVSDFGLLLLLTAFGMYQLIISRQRTHQIIFILWIISGPLLVMYMKFPLPENISDSGYYFGTLLRLRMLLLSQLLLGLITIMGTQSLALDVNKRYPFINVAHISLFLGTLFVISNLYFNSPQVKNYTFARDLAQQVLNPLPPSTILFVDDDFVFTLLYQQQVDQLRTDVTIIPTTFAIRSNEINKNFAQYIGYQYSDHDTQIAYAIAWNISQQRPVATFALSPQILEILGHTGSPFYIYPHGYTLMIGLSPTLINQTNYYASHQLDQYQLHKDKNWQLGWEGKLSYIHTALGYYAAQNSAMQIADENFDLASSLSQLPHNQAIVSHTITQSTIVPPSTPINFTSSDWYLQALSASSIQEKIFLAQRSILLNPLYVPAHVFLSELYAQNGLITQSVDHLNIIQHLTQLQ